LQYQHIGVGVKGCYRLAAYALKYGMNNNKSSSVAVERLSILEFWSKHGFDATLDAFGHSKRALYYWRRRYIDEYTDYGIVLAVPRLNSSNVTHFLQCCQKLHPFEMKKALSTTVANSKASVLNILLIKKH